LRRGRDQGQDGSTAGGLAQAGGGGLRRRVGPGAVVGSDRWRRRDLRRRGRRGGRLRGHRRGRGGEEGVMDEHVETTDESVETPSLEERLAEAEARAEEYLALAQRTQADFENYRKRAVRDQESLVARAHERVVKELLPILDDLERALDAATAHE